MSTVGSVLVEAQDRVSFEVASIKRSQRTDQAVDLGLLPGGGLRTTNMPVLPLIWLSHGVQAFQIIDAPDWVRTERYDIATKPPNGVSNSRDVQFAMIRSLLEDRFGLRVRRDRRQMPVYNLVMARSDGRLGPRLKQASADCAAESGSATAPDAPPPPPDAPSLFTAIQEQLGLKLEAGTGLADVLVIEQISRPTEN